MCLGGRGPGSQVGQLAEQLLWAGLRRCLLGKVDLISGDLSFRDGHLQLISQRVLLRLEFAQLLTRLIEHLLVPPNRLPRLSCLQPGLLRGGPPFLRHLAEPLLLFLKHKHRTLFAIDLHAQRLYSIGGQLGLHACARKLCRQLTRLTFSGQQRGGRP